jgi:hypothetical protein
LNFDPPDGGDADGFACKLHPGAGNVFKGCRSWENSDDGWDLYKCQFDIVLEDCWTWHNGDPASFGSSDAGNAGGFKIGGDSGFTGPRLLKRCIAFKNHYGGSGAGKAYQQNDHKGQITLLNCLSFSNNYNYALNNDVAVQHVVKNCVSFDPYGNDHKLVSSNNNTIYVNNSWQLPVTPNIADYVGPLTEETAKAPRQADGSLPNNGFARLVSGSDLIDKGVDVGLPYNGSAPDLGPFEFALPQGIVSIDSVSMTATGLSLHVTGLTSHGSVIVHTSPDLTTWTPVFTNVPVTGGWQYVDPAATNQPQQFYRIQEQ